MNIIDKRFPNWEFDLENGTIFSLKSGKYLGSINKYNNHVFVGTNGGYKQNGLHQYIWMVGYQCDIPDGYDIHHKDFNPLNNKIDNLELIEHSRHLEIHKVGFKKDIETKEKISNTLKNNIHTSKKVAQYTLDGELVKIWESISETGRNDFNFKSVCACCQGKRKTHKGFIWKYYEGTN